LKKYFTEDTQKVPLSKITDVIKEEIDAWQFRPLQKKYFAIYIDALFINLKRNTVEKEAPHIALDIHLDGKKEILGFWIKPT